MIYLSQVVYWLKGKGNVCFAAVLLFYIVRIKYCFSKSYIVFQDKLVSALFTTVK
jgi:hypothetical protein